MITVSVKKLIHGGPIVAPPTPAQIQNLPLIAPNFYQGNFNIPPGRTGRLYFEIDLNGFINHPVIKIEITLIDHPDFNFVPLTPATALPDEIPLMAHNALSRNANSVTYTLHHGEPNPVIIPFDLCKGNPAPVFPAGFEIKIMDAANNPLDFEGVSINI